MAHLLKPGATMVTAMHEREETEQLYLVEEELFFIGTQPQGEMAEGAQSCVQTNNSVLDELTREQILKLQPLQELLIALKFEQKYSGTEVQTPEEANGRLEINQAVLNRSLALHIPPYRF